MNLEFNTGNHSWGTDDRGEATEQPEHRTWKQFVNGKNKVMVYAVGTLGFAVCICLLGYLVYSEDSLPENTKKTLQFTSIIFRHGARTPTGTYNSDPYKYYNWPGGLGSLTNEGKLQLYNLGQKLRKEYGSFLPEEYLEKDIYIVSSDASRTISSASTLLAGLYPPTASQKWHPNIPWQPIPVHTIPRNMDKILAIKKTCEESLEQYQSVKKQPEIVDRYQNLFDNLTSYTNQTVQDVLSVELLYSVLQIENENGMKLPKWTKELFPEKFREATCTSFDTFTYNTALKRFHGGPLLSEILTNMKKKHDGNLHPDRKMFLYSGHDLTISALWRTLGFEECLLPEYGAALAIEMHMMPETTDSEIKMLYYNNTKVKNAHELQIPNCISPCTLSQLQNITIDLIPTDWESECKNNQ